MKTWLSPARLAAMLCLAALPVFCERVAHAGEWVISYERDGAVTQDPSNWTAASAYAPIRPGTGAQQPLPTTSCSASVSASYRAIATWQGEDWDGDGIADEPPPGKLVFKETGYGSVRGGGNAYGPSGQEILPTNMTVTNPIETTRTSSETSISTWGIRWTQVDNASRALVVKLPARQFAASGEISNMPEWDGWGGFTGWPAASVTCAIRYSAQAWTAPFIYAPHIEVSYAKGTPPIQNERESDMSITTDSVVSWSEVGQYWYAAPRFVCIQDFFPNPVYNWSISGASGYIMNDSPDVEAHLTFGDNSSGQSLGETSLVRVNVTDSDLNSPIYSNSFTVRWHWPWENITQYGQEYTGWDAVLHLEVDNPDGYAIYPGGVNCHWTYDSPYKAAAQEAVEGVGQVIDAFELVGVPVPKLVKKLLDAAGLVASDGPKQKSGVAPWAWDEQGSTHYPSKNDDAQPFYRMYPGLEVGYKITFWKYDEYNVHGYTGPGRTALRAYNGGEKWVGHFVRSSDDGSGPPTP